MLTEALFNIWVEKEKRVLKTKKRRYPHFDPKINFNKNISFFKSYFSDQKNVAQLNAIKNGLEKERERINNERVREEEERFERMKKTWAEHENNVKNKIQFICQTYLIKYVDKVPFKGNPDNTIEICEEFIIFDAKSPASNDLSNFSNYIKSIMGIGF